MKYGKIIEGNITMYQGDDISETEIIKGYVNVYENAQFKAPKLTSVGGSVYVYENAQFTAPKLTSVGGYVSVYENAQFTAPKLTSVGGSVNVHKNATFKRNKHLKTNYDNAQEVNFNSFLSSGYLFADKILAKIVSKKGNVYKIQICGKTKISYCVQQDSKFAHGDTIKEARESLIYKLSDRDTSKYKSWTLETVITKERAIESYMAITGACSAGTRHFVERLPKVKGKYKVKEIIKLTTGQYNANMFKQFFEVK